MSRPLDLTLISAKDLNNVNFLSKMDVYAVATLSTTKLRTPTDHANGKNPTWNATLRFNLPNHPTDEVLHVLLRCDRALGDRDVGEVNIPVRELVSDGGEEKRFVSYQVRTTCGKAKPKGVLNVAYKVGEVGKAEAVPVGYNPTGYPQSAYLPPQTSAAYAYPPPSQSSADKPYPPPVQPSTAMPYPPPVHDTAPAYPPPGHGTAPAYPPPGHGTALAYPPPGHGTAPTYPPPGHASDSAPYPPPSKTSEATGYPSQAQPSVATPYPAPGGYPGYGAPPAGYPPAGYPPTTYSAPPPPGGYGYPGYGAPVVQPQKPPKKNKLGLGLGAGLLGGALGGLLIGDAISDAGGYDGGFDDGGGFDF